MLFAACNSETPLAGPAEDYVGAFRDAYPDLVTENITFLTKWVPRPGPMPLAAVESALSISRRCVLSPRGLPTARHPSTLVIRQRPMLREGNSSLRSSRPSSRTAAAPRATGAATESVHRRTEDGGGSD
jgi:hypothetical protein